MPDFSFTREERLKSRKEIGGLFSGAESFGQYPLRLVWADMSERRSSAPVQFAVSVPKRRFKKAVQRNRIRRQVREAYRLHKHRLYEVLGGEGGQQVAFMVLYTGQEAQPYEAIEQAMKLMIRRFLQKYGRAK